MVRDGLTVSCDMLPKGALVSALLRPGAPQQTEEQGQCSASWLSPKGHGLGQARRPRCCRGRRLLVQKHARFNDPCREASTSAEPANISTSNLSET